jgi:hypothetical protein
MKKQGIRDKGKCTAKIEINGISLILEPVKGVIKSRYVTKLVMVDLYLVKSCWQGFNLNFR